MTTIKNLMFILLFAITFSGNSQSNRINDLKLITKDWV